MKHSINTIESAMEAMPLVQETAGNHEALSSERWAAMNWSLVSVMAVLHVGAVAALFFFSWQALVLSLVLLWLSCSVGISISYHRLLAHRSFRTPKWMEYALTVCGALAMQGGPIYWVATHRVHHAHTDRAGDICNFTVFKCSLLI